MTNLTDRSRELYYSLFGDLEEISKNDLEFPSEDKIRVKNNKNSADYLRSSEYEIKIKRISYVFSEKYYSR